MNLQCSASCSGNELCAVLLSARGRNAAAVAVSIGPTWSGDALGTKLKNASLKNEGVLPLPAGSCRLCVCVKVLIHKLIHGQMNAQMKHYTNICL